jgi:anti-sigma regulatory factor (Ser/Thr protein kinase)
MSNTTSPWRTRVGNVRSIAALESELSFRVDLARKVRPLLKRMQSLGMVCIEGDLIEVHKNNFRFKLGKRAQARLFPALFEIAADRAIHGIEDGEQKPLLFSISEDPDTRAEICSAIESFRARMREIGERVKARPNPTGARMVGLVTAPMLGADFVNRSDSYDAPETWSPHETRRRLRELAQAAHDIRPAIAALRALKAALPPEVDSDVQTMMTLLFDRIEKIAEDFLPTVERRIGYTPSELVSLLARVIAERRHYSGSEVKWEVELQAHSPVSASVPEKEMERVITNLLKNAVEALTESLNRMVRVQLKHENRKAKIVIEDSGCGIGPGLVTQIRRGEFHTSKFGGSGLGLRHAIETIERAGGEFSIDSKTGSGTRIEITIPVTCS